MVRNEEEDEDLVYMITNENYGLSGDKYERNLNTICLVELYRLKRVRLWVKNME